MFSLVVLSWILRQLCSYTHIMRPVELLSRRSTPRTAHTYTSCSPSIRERIDAISRSGTDEPAPQRSETQRTRQCHCHHPRFTAQGIIDATLLRTLHSRLSCHDCIRRPLGYPNFTWPNCKESANIITNNHPS